MNFRKGFTILESLIVLAVLFVLTVVIIALLKSPPEEKKPARTSPASAEIRETS